MARISIEYESNKVKSLFANNCSGLIKELDRGMARKIQSHISNLRASTDFMQFVALGIGKPHPVNHILEGCYGVHVSANVRLILEPVSESLEPAALKACCVVRVKGVCDYHGGKTKWYIP